MTDALRDAQLLARAVLSAPGAGRHNVDALRGYEATRDEVSAKLRDLTERIASYTWDLDELRDLLWQVSRAMQPEVRMLLARRAGRREPGSMSPACVDQASRFLSRKSTGASAP